MTPAGRTMFCALQRCQEGAAIDAEIGELPDRELDEDALVLRTDDLDLRHVRDEQQARPDRLHMVAQFTMPVKPSAVKP
jgi:hypothetical protein